MYHIVNLALFLYSFTYLYCSEMTTNKQLLHALIDQDNNPTPSLLKILTITESQHNGTLPSITHATQQWLRPAGKERWENQNAPISMNKQIPQLFKELCLVQKIEPLHTSYDYALFLGGTLDDVRNRLAYLITLWNKGIRFNSLVILAGQRPLDATLENHELLLNNNNKDLSARQNWYFNGRFPTNESEMITFVFEQTDTPAAWSNISRILIDTPMQMGETGSLRRPNTQDTIIQWLKECNPRTGSTIAISNQPFVGYQNRVTKNTLPKQFTIETVGSAYAYNESIATIFDTLARWVYNENEYRHNPPAKY